MSPKPSFLALSAELNRHGTPQVRACLLDLFGDEYRLAGWIGPDDLPDDLPNKPAPGVDADLPTLPDQMRRTIQMLGDRLGRPLWDKERGQPWTESQDPVRIQPVGQVMALATPLPRLRVWVAGLTQSGVDGAAQAVNGSLARVVGTTRLGRESHPTQLAELMAENQPQVLVICGGMDSNAPGAQEPILALCDLIGHGLTQIPPNQRPGLLYAGNAAARAQAEVLLGQAGGPSRLMNVANVQPVPGTFRQTPITQTLHRMYGALADRLPSMTRLARWTASAAPVEGVDWGFARLLRLWAEYRNLPDLHGIYCGDEWWLHGWVARREPNNRGNPPVRLLFAEPATRPPAVDGWPPVRWVSGAWPDALWPRPAAIWHDPHRLAPAVASLGQIDPQAALQVLSRDILSGEL